MASIDVGDPETVAPASQLGGKNPLEGDAQRDSIDYEKQAQHVSDKIDKEVAQYAHDDRAELSPERDALLKKKIDKRVLSIMIFTYFLQAIDKGTLSFASIMGLLDDTGLANEDGSPNAKVYDIAEEVHCGHTDIRFSSPGSLHVFTLVCTPLQVCCSDHL